ncbi:MAG: YihY/virulence factor BrkB family protein [Salinibacterium sp.]|nr:MAG: YihY/virulence factor BrkB family protein [Salinibacterium sp.]
MGVKVRVASVITRIERLKLVRVLRWQVERRGQLLAAGLSYQAIFAVFAAIWVGFAVAGAIIRTHPTLESALFRFLATNVPGLIDDGSGKGAIDPKQLLEAGILNWTGAIAAGALLLTALGWLASGREAVRSMFELPPVERNFFLLKLRDVVLATVFAAAFIASAVLTVISTTALHAVLGALGVDTSSIVAVWLARAVGLAILLALDTVVLALFLRLVSEIRIPSRFLWRGALLGALAIGVLKVLGSSLLGGATRNPLLASFAVIIGLLIWFNLVSQVIVLTAAWIEVSARDAGVTLRRPVEARAL